MSEVDPVSGAKLIGSITISEYIKSQRWTFRVRVWWMRWKWPTGMHWRIKRMFRP